MAQLWHRHTLPLSPQVAPALQPIDISTCDPVTDGIRVEASASRLTHPQAWAGTQASTYEMVPHQGWEQEPPSLYITFFPNDGLEAKGASTSSASQNLSITASDITSLSHLSTAPNISSSSPTVIIYDTLIVYTIKMAHFNLDDSDTDESGYTPSPQSLAELKRVLSLHHPLGHSQASWHDDSRVGAQGLRSHIMTKNKTATGRPWVFNLSLSDLEEIEAAVTYFEDTGLPLNRLQSSVFPLPKLAIRLRQLAGDLTGKQPYFMLKGLRPQWYSKRKNVVIYLGVASHIGNKRAMAAGEPDVLHHITDMPIPTTADIEADGEKVYRGPANRTMPIPFHNDYGEILSLFCMSTPFVGGAFYLSDIHDIAERIALSRPDLLHTLREDWILVNPGSPRGYDKRPLLFAQPNGRLAVCASRSRIFGTPSSPRPACLPPLSEQQVQAVDALHAAGRELCVKVEFQEGDMLFFNNMRMMHARDGYVDGDESQGTTKRYLMRLILRGGDGNTGKVVSSDNEECSDDEEEAGRWHIPAELRQMWEELYEHRDDEEVISIHEKLFSFKTSH